MMRYSFFSSEPKTPASSPIIEPHVDTEKLEESENEIMQKEDISVDERMSEHDESIVSDTNEESDNETYSTTSTVSTDGELYEDSKYDLHLHITRKNMELRSCGWRERIVYFLYNPTYILVSFMQSVERFSMRGFFNAL